MNKNLAAVFRLQPKQYQQLAKAFEDSGFYAIDSRTFPDDLIYAFKGGDLILATPRCGYLDISLENMPGLIAELQEIYNMLNEREVKNA